VERSSSRKVNSINEERNKELTAKLHEIITLSKGKEQAQFNAITNTTVEDADLIAGNPYNSVWKS
jgi:hypothetical protein